MDMIDASDDLPQNNNNNIDDFPDPESEEHQQSPLQIDEGED